MARFRGIKLHGLLALMVLGFLTFSPIIVNASAGEPPCMGYAYSADENHYFLVNDNSTNFGNTIFVKHNCDLMSIYVDEEIYQTSSTNFTIFLNEGEYNISLISQNFTAHYHDVFVIDSSLEWLNVYEEIREREDVYGYITTKDGQIMANWASVGTSVVLWCLCVGVYWRLINHYIDRNYFEEVI